MYPVLDTNINRRMIMPEIKQRKRTLEWWRESNEIPDAETRLQEKYDSARLTPGWSGRDAPPVEKMGSGYAGKEARFDKLGSGSAGASKTKKGDGQEGAPEVKEVKKTGKKRVQEVGDDMDLEMPEDEFENEGDINPEDDIPPEMGDEALEGEESEEMAQDVTVMIDGKEYTLVPKEEEMMGDEMGEEPPMEDEMGGGDEAAMNGGVAAEPMDVTRQESKKKVTRRVREDEGSVPAAGGDFTGEVDYDKVLEAAMSDAKKRAKEGAIRKALQAKKMAEKQLAELFTGEYVLNKQGEPGFDFKPVAGDEKFAVVDRAASGNQFTPTDSDSPYEPDSKGGKTAHMTKPKGDSSYNARKEAFKKWIATQEKKFTEDESDPGQDSEQFNSEDVFAKNAIKPLSPEQYPETPEIVGKDEDTLTDGKVSENKEYKKVQQRRQLRRESEQPVKFPSKEVKEDLEQTMEESFDFKKLIRGEYKEIKG
jgi:hypothetical protein